MNKQMIMSHDIMPLIKELLEQDQEVLLTVSGTSMNPFYHDKKTVVQLLKSNQNMQRFDVVLYEYQGRFRLHRIIKVEDDLFVICGDANSTYEYVSRDKIFGLVIAHKNKNKWIHRQSTLNNIYITLWSLLRPFRRILLRISRRKKRD